MTEAEGRAEDRDFAACCRVLQPSRPHVSVSFPDFMQNAKTHHETSVSDEPEKKLFM